MRLFATAVTAVLLAAACAWCAGAPVVPNPGFEQGEVGGVPAEWSPYNWGTEGAPQEVGLDGEGAHSGQMAVRARSVDGAARPGVYTKVSLEAGRYALRLWARAASNGADGRPTALVRAYLADGYSPPMLVGDEWTELVFEHTVKGRHLRGEVNVQSFGGEPGTVWFDDVSVEALPAVEAEVVADPRPEAEQPKLLYFCGNVNYVRDTARDWAGRGFSGFFFGGMFDDWATDVWAKDGDPATEGEDDGLLREARAAVEEMRAKGLGESILKVAFYSTLPDPFVDGEYARLTENFRQGARFAKAAGFPAIAIDTEYVAEQYEYAWEGYATGGRTKADLASKLRERWQGVGEVIGEAYPEAQVCVLPEGAMYYGPLWMEVFGGLLEGLQAGGSEGKVHLLCEGTYSMVAADEIRDHAAAVRAVVAARLTGQARDVWRERGRLALGVWPLGYYREIKDAAGEFLGWSGKEETFGDKVVGSYADKSERYPLEDFRRQLAAARTYSDDYVWVYGHGATWWQVTEAQADEYAQGLHAFPRENSLLPAVLSIGEYYRAAAGRNVVRAR